MSEPSDRARSREKTTSSASKAALSWKAAFGRSLKSQMVGSRVSSQDAASAGTILPSDRRRMRGS